MVDIVRLAIERGEQLKALPKTIIEERGRTFSENPKVEKDDEIFRHLQPLKMSGSLGEDVFKQIWDLVWKIEDTVETSTNPILLENVLADYREEILSLTERTDNAFGIYPFDHESTTTRFYREVSPPSQTTATAAGSPADPDPLPSGPNPAPAYSFHMLLVQACEAGHAEGLKGKQRTFLKRSTNPQDILANAGIRSEIVSIRETYPGINVDLLLETLGKAAGRAQQAGQKKHDFFIDYSLEGKEIQALRKDSSYALAFPDMATELGQLDAALANKPKDHNMAMPPLRRMDPSVYVNPDERNRLVGTRRAEPAPIPEPEPAPLPGRGERRTGDEQGREPAPAEQEGGSWVRRTAAATAATAAVVSIGAGITDNAGSKKQGAQNPDGTQQASPRNGFGKGAKIALGAALAVTALLIAKPELVGLGGNSAGRSR